MQQEDILTNKMNDSLEPQISENITAKRRHFHRQDNQRESVSLREKRGHRPGIFIF